jgi:hypothetical protein
MGERILAAKAKPVLLGEPNLDQLKGICTGLNSEEPWGAELRRLITLWQRSGPNLKAMVYADHSLWNDLTKAFRVLWLPSRTGRSYLQLMPKGDSLDPNSTARFEFLSLTLNPDCDKLGGPCPRCEKYFIRKTARLSVYCSPRCASQDSAIKRTNEVREERHKDKLALAEKARDRWKELLRKGRTKKDWKEWIAASNPEITVRFLTRAVNKGELVAPPQERKKANEKTK